VCVFVCVCVCVFVCGCTHKHKSMCVSGHIVWLCMPLSLPGCVRVRGLQCEYVYVCVTCIRSRNENTQLPSSAPFSLFHFFYTHSALSRIQPSLAFSLSHIQPLSYSARSYSKSLFLLPGRRRPTPTNRVPTPRVFSRLYSVQSLCIGPWVPVCV
jgi:hypothetical protein